jgi:alcohol dehydrogenase (NADP+)
MPALAYADAQPNDPPDLPSADYIKLLRPNGNFVLVGVIPKRLELPVFPLILGEWGGQSLLGILLTPAKAGSPSAAPTLALLARSMLMFAVDHDIQSWIQQYDMKDINKAMPDFKAGKPRYRFVLLNTDNGGKM